jgi:hypothetical protein
LGDINISLSPFITSTGIVEPLSPDQPDFFPALNTNNLFFRYEFSGLGIPSLLSSDPVTIQAIIDSIPPDGAIYDLINPVHLFIEGDPLQSTIAIITSAEIHFTGIGPALDFISPCPAPEPSTFALLGIGIFVLAWNMHEGWRV